MFTNTTQNEAPFGEKLGERRPLKAYSVDALFLCFLGLIARLLSSVAETLSIHSFILLPHLQHYTAVRKSSTHSAVQTGFDNKLSTAHAVYSQHTPAQQLLRHGFPAFLTKLTQPALLSETSVPSNTRQTRRWR